MPKKIKMTDEQRDIFDTFTSYQKQIVTNVLLGMKPAEAHKATGRAASNEDIRRKLAHKVLSKPAIKNFIEMMQACITEEAVTKAVMNREEVLLELSEISRLNPEETCGDRGTVHNILSVIDRKIVAMRDLSKLLGYQSPEKIEHSGTVATAELSAEEYKKIREEMIKNDDC